MKKNKIIEKLKKNYTNIYGIYILNILGNINIRIYILGKVANEAFDLVRIANGVAKKELFLKMYPDFVGLLD